LNANYSGAPYAGQSTSKRATPFVIAASYTISVLLTPAWPIKNMCCYGLNKIRLIRQTSANPCGASSNSGKKVFPESRFAFCLTDSSASSLAV
jgi:hypothetical protein